MVQRQSFSYLRLFRPSNNFVDQWSLIHVGLAAVRYTTDNHDLWVNLFIAVNLHPKYMLAFQEWCINIDPFMQSYDSFHLVTQSNIDMYSLLPLLWQVITLYDKGKAVSIFQQHDFTWSVECLVDMKTTHGVAIGDISSIQLGIWIAIDNPYNINRGNEDVPIVVPTTA